MARHAGRRPILAALLILFSFPAIVFAQGSVSKPKHVESPAAAIHRTKPDAELEAISKAEQEGRLLDAEKLLNSAIARAEKEPPPRSHLGMLLNELADVENRMHHYKLAVAAEKRAVTAHKALGPGAISRVMMDLQELGAYARFGGDCATFAEAATEQLALARRYPGPQDDQLLRGLSTLAAADHCEGHDAEARKLQAEQVRICEAQLEPHSPGCVSILAGHYRETGHAGYAEKLVSQPAARTPDFSPGFLPGTSELPKVFNLQALARQYEADHLYDQAVATDRQLIALIQRTTKHPVYAAAFYDSLGRDLEKEGHDAEAEAAFKRSFVLREHATGRGRDQWIESLSKAPLVLFYRRQGRLPDAEAVLERALADQQGALDPKDGALAYTLVQLASLEMRQGESSDAEPLCERALKIQEADYGPDNPQLLSTLDVYAAVERRLHKKDKANALSSRAAAIRQKLRGRY